MGEDEHGWVPSQDTVEYAYIYASGPVPVAAVGISLLGKLPIREAPLQRQIYTCKHFSIVLNFTVTHSHTRVPLRVRRVTE